jgi:hypothetical protein
MVIMLTIAAVMSLGTAGSISANFERLTQAEAVVVTGAVGSLCTIGDWACQAGSDCPLYPEGGEYCLECDENLRNMVCIPFVIALVCTGTTAEDCDMGRPGSCDLLLGCVKDFFEEEVSCGTQDQCVFFGQ